MSNISINTSHDSHTNIILFHKISCCKFTNITTNGNADDITKVYDSVNKSRLGIAGKLKGIARIIDNSLDSYDYNVVADDNSTNEINDDLLL